MKRFIAGVLGLAFFLHIAVRCGGGGAPAVILFVTSSLTNAIFGQPYNAEIKISGATLPVTWQIATGALPSGLNFCNGETTLTCTITGTAAQAGSFTFTVRATDSAIPPNSNQRSFTLQVTQPPQYNLVLAISGQGTVNMNPPNFTCTPALQPCTQPYTSGASVTLTANPTSGWQFAGFGGDPDCADGLLTMSANRTCTATFSQIPPNQFVLQVTVTGQGSVTSNPAGINCPGDCNESYIQGTPVTLMAAPTAGWQFTGFTGDPDCTDGQVTLIADRNCTATFIQLPPNQFVLQVAINGQGSVTSNPAGINCPGDCNEPYIQGTPVTLTATPTAGWQFAGFSGDADCADGQVIMSADRTCTATFSQPGSGNIQDVQTVWNRGGHTSVVYSVAFSPDGTKVVSGSQDLTIKIWDASTGSVIRTLTGHTDTVSSVAFSPDGTRVVSGSWDTTIKIWDANTGSVIRTLTGHTASVSSVAFSPDGTKVVSGGGDATIKIWDASTGNLIRTLTGHTNPVWSVAFSPDGTKIVSGGYDYTLRIWDANTGNLIRTLTGHGGQVLSVAFSPDGTKVMSGSGDNTLKIWDANTGTLIRTLTGHGGQVLSVAFSPDGTKVVSGSGDFTLKIWNANTGNLIRTLTGHTLPVWSVAWSRDGNYLASGGGDMSVILWRITYQVNDSSPPTVPPNLSATAVSPSEIGLSWGASTDNVAVTGYNLWRDGAFLKTVMTTATNDTALTNATRYCYSVSATDAAGNESAQSAQACATTGLTALSGPPNDPANAHIPDLAFDVPLDAEVAIDNRPNGTGLPTARTQVLVEFKDAATVADANSQLQSLGAVIIGTVPSINLLLLSIPDTGDFSGLDNALNALQGNPAVGLASQNVELGLTTLSVPSNATDAGGNAWIWNYPPSNGVTRDGNWGMEAVRAPQMWNLNAYARRKNSPPVIGVLDAGFNDTNPAGGDGINDHPQGDVPGLQTWIFNPALAPAAFAPGARVHRHGEHVAGTIGSRHNDGIGVEGINPFAEPHNPADGHFIGVSVRGWWPVIIQDLANMLANWPGLRVINMSLGYNWYLNNAGPDPNTQAAWHATAQNDGTLARQIMAANPGLVLAAAAGNDSGTGSGYPNEILAMWATPMAWAALGPTVPNPATGNPLSPSTNIIVVESMDPVVANTGDSISRWEYTKSDFSNVGGTVSAPGGQILSAVGNNIPGNANYVTLSGTSMAAPHVTGLIGYLLNLDNTLTVPQLIQLVTSANTTRTTGLNAVDAAMMPPGVPNSSPMIDAFSAAMGIDLLRGNKNIQKALVDVDDGTPDGNLRVRAFPTDLDPDTINTPDQRRGDGTVTMRDFRAWRDAYLQFRAADFTAAGLTVTLDGPASHFKRDASFDGCVGTAATAPAHPVDVPVPPAGCANAPPEEVGSRYDFNGDGELRATRFSPFKIDPDTQCNSLNNPAGCWRDLDVLADPGIWADVEADGYREGVEATPGLEGNDPGIANEWKPQRYLLAERDQTIGSVPPLLQGLPDYIHSADLHIQLDWNRIHGDYEAVHIQVSSEIVADYLQTFDREIKVPFGAQPLELTLPIWTGKVKVTFEGIDDETPNPQPADPGYLGTTTKELTGLAFGEDRALIFPRFPVVVANYPPGRTNLAADPAGNLFIADETLVSSGGDGSEVRKHNFSRSTDGGITWTNTMTIQEQRRRDRMAVGPEGNVYIVHVIGNPSDPAPLGNASVQLIRSIDGGVNFLPPVQISTAGTSNVDFYADVAVDSAGKVYVVWAESGTDFGAANAKNPYLIKVRTSTNGGQSFSAPIIVSATVETDDLWNPIDAQIGVTAAGQMHVTWAECKTRNPPLNNCILFSVFYSRFTGSDFAPPVEIAQNQFIPGVYDMAVDDSGSVSVVYATHGPTNSTVRYARVENGLPVRNVDVSGTPFNNFAFTARVMVDGLGSPWITWAQNPSGVPSEVYATSTIDGGQSFLPIINISESASTPSGASSLAPDASGAPLIAWGEQGTLLRMLFRPVLNP